jgi:hypothetical protein
MEARANGLLTTLGNGDQRLFHRFAVLKRSFNEVQNRAGAFRPAQWQGQKEMEQRKGATDYCNPNAEQKQGDRDA